MFIISCISTVIAALMGIYILRIKNKKQIHYIFSLTIFCVFLWCFSFILDYIDFMTGHRVKYLLFAELNIMVFSISFFPVMFLLIGIIFRNNFIKFNYKYLLLFLSPILNFLLFLTNKYHHLSFKDIDNYEWGPYFIFNMAYSYVCVAVGFIYLIYFSIKNAGYFSNQAKLIIIGIIVPAITNILSIAAVLLNAKLPQAFYTFEVMPVSFTFTIICYAFAILKFDFLNVVPIALQKVVDLISDGFVVIDEEFKVIDFNKTFIDDFDGIIKINRKDNFIEVVDGAKVLNLQKEDLENTIRRAIEKKKSFSFEQHILRSDFDKHFTIEITPIHNQDKHIGTIILFKDITQHKNDLELIKQTQNQLVERERLASLGELTAGMAHEINTPLSAIQSNLFQLKAYLNKSKSGVQNNLNQEELLKLITGMDDVVQKADNTSKKIAAIINSVRNNTRNLGGENVQAFELSSIINDLKLMLTHQLKATGCELVYSEDAKVELKGDPGKLGQVLTNFIVNAMQAYEEAAGAIEVNAENRQNEVVISVKDHGKGIPEEIKDRIFKEMLSTKGAQGTGLGMYISNSIISGNFGGRTWLESEEGKGTTVFIAIPKSKN